MSWHCSRVWVEEYSAATFSDGDASVQLSTTPTPEAYYWPDKTTEHSRLSRFGMTSEPLMASRGEELLTWYLAAFPARTSVQRAKVLASTESEVDSGVRWHGSFAKYDPNTSSWKTPQCSLLGDLTAFLETWPAWGSMRNGACWERTTPMLPTKETGFGFLPTPTASNTKAFNARGADKGKPREPRSYGARGPLNPPFLEWLMGWPMGWTKLEALETAKFQEWQQQHSLSYPDASTVKAAA